MAEARHHVTNHELLQHAAQAHGERVFSEVAIKVSRGLDDDYRMSFLQLLKLYQIQVVEKNMDWFLSKGFLVGGAPEKLEEIAWTVILCQ